MCVFIIRRKYITTSLSRLCPLSLSSLSLSGRVDLYFCVRSGGVFIFQGKGFNESLLSSRRISLSSKIRTTLLLRIGNEGKTHEFKRKNSAYNSFNLSALELEEEEEHQPPQTRHTRATTTTRCDASPPGFWWFRAKG